MESFIEITLTIIGISFWILFPVGMFLTMGHLEKNTNQVFGLGQFNHNSNDKFDWHHPLLYFRQWRQH